MITTGIQGSRVLAPWNISLRRPGDLERRPEVYVNAFIPSVIDPMDDRMDYLVT